MANGAGMAGCLGGAVVLGGCAVVLVAALVGGVVALALFVTVNPIITTTIVLVIAVGLFRAWQLQRRRRKQDGEPE